MAEELFTAAILSFLASLYYASSARWHCTEVPWLDFFRHPSFFGGRESLRRGLVLFLFWYLLSAFLWVLILLLFKRLVPIDVHSYWDGYQYSHILALLTINMPSFVCYMVVVGRTKRLLRKYGPGMSQDIIDSNKQDAIENKNRFLAQIVRMFSNYTDANKQTHAGPIKFILPIKFFLDSYHLVLASFYITFYDHYLTLVSGCSSLLLHKYGPNTIIDFCSYYIITKKPLIEKIDLSRLDYIKETFKDDIVKQARAIAYEKVAVHGYYTVEHELYKYVVERQRFNKKNGRQEPSQRMFFPSNRWPWLKRLLRNSYATVTCVQRACRGKADLIECESNGGGYYVSPRKRLKNRLTANIPVAIEVRGHAECVIGQIRHSEARFWDNKVLSGYGIEVSDENGRNALATLAREHGSP